MFLVVPFISYHLCAAVYMGDIHYTPLDKVSLAGHFLSLPLYLWVLLGAPSQSQLLLLWKLDVQCTLLKNK